MGLNFIKFQPKYKENLRINMSNGEDGGLTQGSHTMFTTVIIQHVVHLTGVHVHME